MVTLDHVVTQVSKDILYAPSEVMMPEATECRL